MRSQHEASVAAPRPGVLEGRGALVTGAGSGIGRAITTLLAREGASVLAMDVDPVAAAATRDALIAEGHRVAVFVGDVTRDAECRAAVADLLGRFQRLDLLVNNAGIIRRASVPETSEQDWDRTLAVNAKSVFLMSRAAIPTMASAGGGVIVNVASNWGLSGGPRAAAYCASTGAVVQLTRAMAVDHGPQGIRVNCVCPGDVDTPMLRDEARQLDRRLEEFLAESAANPLGRVGRPEDVARAVLFLASDASAFVTGTALTVDGGHEAG